MRLVIWLCLTLCDPMDGTPPGSSVREILQARIPPLMGWLLSKIRDLKNVLGFNVALIKLLGNSMKVA